MKHGQYVEHEMRWLRKNEEIPNPGTKQNCRRTYGNWRPAMKRKFVILLVAILSTNVLAQPPPEITKHFAEPGTVLAVYPLLSDSDLEYIIIAQHGPFYIILRPLGKPVWKFSNDEVLEIIIAIDKRPHVLWSRDPPT
jgi:hypothetical protein